MNHTLAPGNPASPVAPPSAAGPDAVPAGPAPRLAYAVAALLTAVILLQRFAVPIGSFHLPVVLPLGLVFGAALVARGSLRASPVRVILFAAAGGAVTLAAYAASWDTTARLTALLMVLAVFSLWVLRAPGPAVRNDAGARVVMGCFVSLMLVAATVGILQMVLQLLGVWSYRDLVGEWVPPRFLIPDYNITIPVTFGSSIHKSQGVVFLEPSIFSQFTALALVVAVLLRRPTWQLVVLVAGLVTALSGTGLLLLAAGLVALAVRPRRLRPSYVVAGVVAIAAVLLSPAGDILRDRTGEVNHATSSLGLRFVLPYVEVAEGLAAEPRRWIHGAGPGAADRELESARESAGLAVVYTAPSKLVFEYGLPAAVLLLLFVVTTLFRGAPSRVVATVLMLQLFFLGGYLVAPHALLTAWCLCVLWGRRD